MALTTIVPGLIALLGALVYLLASKAEAKELGRLCFACGLLVLLFALDGKSISLGVR